ncbi:MAG: anion permease [Planctomycetia bacterium]|nr:anion permease [Planctomycetia bacterium]
MDDRAVAHVDPMVPVGDRGPGQPSPHLNLLPKRHLHRLQHRKKPPALSDPSGPPTLTLFPQDAPERFIMEFFDAIGSLSTGQVILLIVALVIAFGFECINGFHDTANAVATVIYTKSLKPTPAVVWSGIWNFIGVHAGGIGVAFSIVHLLPVDLLVNIKTGKGLAMVLALLLAAIIWNFATWYRGLPASSSHSLIGSIMGVGMMNAWLEHGSLSKGINWHKASEVGAALLFSPLIGFGLAAGLLLLLQKLVPAKELYEPPKDDSPPPWWIRGLLIGTCTGVSFAHGSNDGQKGMGLIMLVLIGIVPAAYALDMGSSQEQVAAMVAAAKQLEQELSDPGIVKVMEALKAEHLATTRVEELMKDPKALEFEKDRAIAASIEPYSTFDMFEPQSVVDRVFDPYPRADAVLATLDPLPLARQVVATLDGKSSFGDLDDEGRWQLRTHLVELGASVRTLVRSFGDRMAEDRRKVLKGLAGELSEPVEYVPEWVKMGVALCLGLGTMVGWQRIVVTVGEKIGKTHLTYAQGAAAELVAATTIGLADVGGLPVSTTHVLSSGVAGTMWANKSGIQPETVREIALAWILTLPVAMALSGGLYFLATLFTG